MNQLSLWSGINTAAMCSEEESQKDGSQECTCGKETSDCSIHPSTPDEWIASMQDSHALICQLLANKLDLQEALDLVSTQKLSASLARYDQDTSLWRTSQLSFATNGLERFSETWPRWGILQDGVVFELRVSEQSIIEIGGGYWPTPTAHNAKECASPAEYKRNEPTLASMVGGKLNPEWIEWLMAVPIGFTDSKD